MAILFLLVNLSPAIKTESSAQVIQTISARLFYHQKVGNQPTSQSLVIEKGNSHIESLNIVDKETEVKALSKVQETRESIQTQKEVVNKISSSRVNKVNSFESLLSLRKKIDQQTYQQSEKQAYADFVASKNFIPRSTTQFNQLPQAQPVKVEISCDNTFSKGLTILSGLLGGSVKCNSFNGSQKFIDARLEKLGKKKDKK